MCREICKACKWTHLFGKRASHTSCTSLFTIYQWECRKATNTFKSNINHICSFTDAGFYEWNSRWNLKSWSASPPCRFTAWRSCWDHLHTLWSFWNPSSRKMMTMEISWFIDEIKQKIVWLLMFTPFVLHFSISFTDHSVGFRLDIFGHHRNSAICENLDHDFLNTACGLRTSVPE